MPIPVCVVDGRSRNPLYYYYYLVQFVEVSGHRQSLLETQFIFSVCLFVSMYFAFFCPSGNLGPAAS